MSKPTKKSVALSASDVNRLSGLSSAGPHKMDDREMEFVLQLANRIQSTAPDPATGTGGGVTAARHIDTDKSAAWKYPAVDLSYADVNRLKPLLERMREQALKQQKQKSLTGSGTALHIDDHDMAFIAQLAQRHTPSADGSTATAAAAGSSAGTEWVKYPAIDLSYADVERLAPLMERLLVVPNAPAKSASGAGAATAAAGSTHIDDKELEFIVQLGARHGIRPPQPKHTKKRPFAELTPGQVNEVNAIIANALREDLGGYGSLGDITTRSTIGPHVTASARFLAKADGVLAGLGVAQRVFDMVDKNLRTDWTACDGDSVTSGQYFGTVSGNARSIIIAERLALNILQRMSGVATATRAMVTQVAHTKTKILDTRKTLPGLRVLEKLAVKIGGGVNHRYGLFDMVMIKDNHVSASGGIAPAVHAVHRFLAEHKLKGTNGGKPIKIELETRTIEEVKTALSIGGVDRLMLDNMVRVDSKTGAVDTTMLCQAMVLINAYNQKKPSAASAAASASPYAWRHIETEASGNVTLQTVRAIAESSGVEYISSGALTHSVIALDISLKIVTAKL